MEENKKQLSIKDIAKISGVSIATVSRVLNKKGKYSLETEKKVLAVADAYGYISNMSAKSLREAKTSTIGLILPNVNNEFFSQLAYYIETYLFKKNYSVFICNSGNQPDKERSYFHTLISKCVDGILCISDLNELPSGILSRDIPIVCIDRRPKTSKMIPWIGNDDKLAFQMATEHLIQKGCRHILYIASYLSEYDRGDRCMGYQNALEANKIFVDKNYILERTGSNPTLIEVEILVYQFLQNGLPLDGIVASNEQAALGALYALQRANLSVPDDVRIIGFDNSLYSLITTPPLSSIERYPQQIASRSCEVLLNMIDHGTADDMEVIVPVSLVERKSTK